MRRATIAVASALVLVVLTLIGTAAKTDELPQPTGRIILEIDGAIDHTNSRDSARLDAEMLDGLGTVEIRTQTPWTAGKAVFRGPLARDVMALVGARGSRVLAVALNDYSVEIPMSDFMSIDSIFATHLNGELMGIRDRGPIWIIFPWDDIPEIRNELYYSRSIWQARSITVIVD